MAMKELWDVFALLCFVFRRYNPPQSENDIFIILLFLVVGR
jgi:hypothetical protein